VKRLAVYFDAPYQVVAKQETAPGLEPGHVLVGTLASAISPGTELLVYRGQVPSDIPIDDTIPALAGKFEYPLKYGYAAVGEVIAVGSEVASDWQGRRVFAYNPHESVFAANPNHLLPLPPWISAEEATLLPTLETVVNLLMDGRPLVGEQVGVFGQGVVGLLVTAALAQFPVASLVTLDPVPLRREKSLSLGAHQALDPHTPGLLPRLLKALQGDRPYRGADLTYELSGDPAALDLAIAATGFTGRVVIGSWYGRKQAPLGLGGRFHRSRISLMSSQVSTISPRALSRWNRNRRWQTALDMLRRLRPLRLVTHRFPVDRAAEAYALLDQSPDEAIQIILTYGGTDHDP
jgi:2-desacetyl-2-hydroxyethyl bacteriochlorophyllide A dehydrogenase